MRNFKKWMYLLITVFSISCEKVIQVNINDAEMKYVIEGVITDQPGDCKVFLTRTRKVSETNQFPKISGAIVKVNDNGTDYILAETSPGVYQTNLLNGTPGHQYKLSVSVNSQLFTASCTMQVPVPIDTILISRSPFGQNKLASVFYTDPRGINNGYRFIQYVNGVKDPAIFWDNDEFTDGQRTAVLLENDVNSASDPRAIHSGDMVKIELLSLDDPIYRFWSTLLFGGADGSSFTASPANPVTNIQGGALGYFSAHSVRSMTVIAP
jgi:hypothetical protein